MKSSKFSFSVLYRFWSSAVINRNTAISIFQRNFSLSNDLSRGCEPWNRHMKFGLWTLFSYFFVFFFLANFSELFVSRATSHLQTPGLLNLLSWMDNNHPNQIHLFWFGVTTPKFITSFSITKFGDLPQFNRNHKSFIHIIHPTSILHVSDHPQPLLPS